MIRLEKFNEKFYDNLIAWVDSEEFLMQFAGPAFTFPLSPEQLDKSLKDPNRYAFSVIDTNTNQIIGYCELYLKDNLFNLGRIVIGDKNQRGKGIGQQIVTCLLDFGFTNFDRTIAELNVFDWNISAIACYKRVGFTVNLYKKLEREMKGETWIAINMTLDKEKWKGSSDT
jgi:RimJ/RimL family protein N-acetyltransferase